MIDFIKIMRKKTKFKIKIIPEKHIKNLQGRITKKIKKKKKIFPKKKLPK